MLFKMNILIIKLDLIYVEHLEKEHICVQDVIKHVHIGNLVIVVYIQKYGKFVFFSVMKFLLL